jgi:hypothetical protein
MRYSNPTLALLASFLGLSTALPILDLIGARANSTVSLAPLLASVTIVTTSVSNFDNTINTLTPGNTKALTALAQSSDTLQQSAVTATGRVNAVQGLLSSGDADQLTTQVQALVATTQAAVTDLVAKKSVIVAAGGGSTVLDILKVQQTAANNFANSLQVKVPKAQQNTAAGFALDISNAFQQGIKAFSAPARRI